MSARTVIKQVIPPLLLELYRRIVGRPHNWEGVFSAFRDVPAWGPGHDGKSWTDDIVEITRLDIAAARSGRAIMADAVDAYEMLLVVAALARQHNDGKLRVLDFGGGPGISYAHLLGGLTNCSGIDYHVVELEHICRAGEELFARDVRIHFHAALPAVLADIDIVYVNGALMYIEDYPALLNKLASYHARYLLLVRHFCGAFPTFASAQKNIRGSVIPYWFFNLNELVQILRHEGYSLMFKGALADVYDLSNFPETHRVEAGRACTLLFTDDGAERV